MCIELANKSTQYPKGITENVIVKINKFVFPVDFVVLDMKEDFRVLIALGRPFLANAHAMINVFNKKISFEVRNEKITFDVEKSMKFSTSCDDTYSFLFEPIINHQPSNDANLWEEENEITMDEEKLRHGLDLSVTLGVFSNLDDLEPDGFKKPTFFAASTTDEGRQIPKLKELPSHLELNPKMQDVVKSEIVKLLDAGLIYDISDSPWISPIHVVPKWVLLLQEFTIEIKDKKGTENLVADHLSRLENPKLEELDEEAIRDSFHDEHLMAYHVKEPEKDPKEWVDKLDDALWAFRTDYKSPIGSTPFRIVYGKACHIAIEMEHKMY
ncbi:reverse transcriptase domain-containing protein [Tanacetum coccineum]